MGNTPEVKQEKKETKKETKLSKREQETLEKTSKTYNFMFRKNAFKGHPDEDRTWITVGNNTKNYVLEFDKLATNVPYGVVEILQQCTFRPVTIRQNKVEVIDNTTGESHIEESPEMKELPPKKLYNLEFVSDEDVKAITGKNPTDKAHFNPIVDTYKDKDISWIKGRTESELNVACEAFGVDIGLSFVEKVKAIAEKVKEMNKK